MTSLLEKLNGEWEDYTDGSKKKFLDKSLEDYSKVSYYVLFGVSTNMSPADIQTVKNSYKKLALIFHPDKSKDKVYEQSASELFKLVNNAYATLTDSSKEQTYRLNHSAESQEKHTATGFNFTGNNGPSVRVYRNNYDRDIKAEEKISSIDEDIIINGNVYGDVKNTSGDIKITGNVFGSVKNVSGDNIINGNIESNGSISSTSGNNKISGNVLGAVKTISGDNKIDGDALGTVSTTSGDNKIKGKVGKNTIQKKPSGGIFFSNGATFSGNVHIVNGKVFTF
jgi:curved DNA-binding protein CbpA